MSRVFKNFYTPQTRGSSNVVYIIQYCLKGKILISKIITVIIIILMMNYCLKWKILIFKIIIVIIIKLMTIFFNKIIIIIIKKNYYGVRQ